MFLDLIARYAATRVVDLVIGLAFTNGYSCGELVPSTEDILGDIRCELPDQITVTSRSKNIESSDPEPALCKPGNDCSGLEPLSDNLFLWE